MKKMFSLIIGAFLGFAVFGLSLVNAQAGGAGGFGGAQTTTYNPTVPGSTALQSDKLLKSITLAINRVLGLLAVIALVVLLWGGFQMVTAAGDDAKYKKGFKILQQAGMGIVFIGISWLFISVIFWVIAKFAG